MDVVLQTRNLGKRFGKRWVVRNANLTIHRGEVFGFLGPNGAGKSTTIRMLLTLIAPSEGSIEYFGMPLRQHRSKVLRRVGGLAEGADFYEYLSARKNLEIVAALSGGIPPRSLDEVLDIVGLLDRRDDKVKTFSHGMKQRLGIAQAILGFPEFIILDEPTSGLDPQGIKEIRELILHLSQERKLTIFLSSHLLSEIEQTATHMAIINCGKLIVQGEVGALLDSGESVVKFDVRPIEKAIPLIQSKEYVESVALIDQGIEVAMPRTHVHLLTALLVNEGIEVHAAVPKRTLEDYFLKITENASDILPSARKRSLRPETNTSFSIDEAAQ